MRLCMRALALARVCLNGALALARKVEYMNIYLDSPLIYRYVSKALLPYNMGNEE